MKNFKNEVTGKKEAIKNCKNFKNITTKNCQDGVI